MKVGNLFACFFSSSATAKVKSEIKRIAKGPGTWGIEVVVVARRGCGKKAPANCSKLCKFSCYCSGCAGVGATSSLANQSRKRLRKPAAARESTPVMSCCVVREKENVRQLLQHLPRSHHPPHPPHPSDFPSSEDFPFGPALAIISACFAWHLVLGDPQARPSLCLHILVCIVFAPPAPCYLFDCGNICMPV